MALLNESMGLNKPPTTINRDRVNWVVTIGRFRIRRDRNHKDGEYEVILPLFERRWIAHHEEHHQNCDRPMKNRAHHVLNGVSSAAQDINNDNTRDVQELRERFDQIAVDLSRTPGTLVIITSQIDGFTTYLQGFKNFFERFRSMNVKYDILREHLQRCDELALDKLPDAVDRVHSAAPAVNELESTIVAAWVRVSEIKIQYVAKLRKL